MEETSLELNGLGVVILTTLVVGTIVISPWFFAGLTFMTIVAFIDAAFNQ